LFTVLTIVSLLTALGVRGGTVAAPAVAAGTGDLGIIAGPPAAGGTLADTHEGIPNPDTWNPLMIFTDGDDPANPSHFTATIDWGDGNTTSSTSATDCSFECVRIVWNNGAGQYEVHGVHVYQDETHGGPENHKINVTVTDTAEGFTAGAGCTACVAVDDQLLTDNSLTPVFKNGPHDQFIGNFSDANPLATPADFPAGNVTVFWTDCHGVSSQLGGFVQQVGGPYTPPKFSPTNFNVFAHFDPTAGNTCPYVPHAHYVAVDDGGEIATGGDFCAPLNPGCPIGSNFVNTGISPKLIEGTQNQYVGRVSDLLTGDTPLTGTVTFKQTSASAPVTVPATFTPVSGQPGMFDIFATFNPGEQSPQNVPPGTGPGLFSLTYTVTNSLSQSFTSANLCPLVSPAGDCDIAEAPMKGGGVPPITVKSGAAIAPGLVLGQFEDAELNDAAADYFADIVFPSAGVPATCSHLTSANGGIVQIATNPNTFQLKIPTACVGAWPTAPGTYSVPITVTDADTTETGPPGYATTNITDQVNVSGPINVTLGTPDFEEGDNTPQPLSNFNEGGSGNTPDISQFTITNESWGDGSTPVPGDIFLTALNDVFGNTCNNDVCVNGQHEYKEQGKYLIQYTITDTVTHATAKVFQAITVSDPALTAMGIPGGISVTEGVPYSGPVATFTDPNTLALASEYIALIKWGDGTTSMGTVTGGSGSFVVNGTHTYADASACTPTCTIMVTITGDGTDSATAETPVTVAEAALISGGSSFLAAQEGKTITAEPLATFNDPAGEPASEFLACIDWGDGTPLQEGQVIALPFAGYEVIGKHAYAEAGEYFGTVYIWESSGLFTGCPPPAGVAAKQAPLPPGTPTPGLAIGFHAEISDAPLMVTVSPQQHLFEGDNVDVNLGSIIDQNPLVDCTSPATCDYTIMINWGDSHTSSEADLTCEIPPNAGVCDIKASHRYAEEMADALITVTVVDTSGGATATGSIEVPILDNVLCESTGVGTACPGTETGPISTVAAVGQQFSGHVGNFCDLDPNGVITDYSATIDWGDGTATSAGTFTPDPASVPLGTGPQCFYVNGTHTFATPGTYYLTITIKDVGGSTLTKTDTVITVSGPAPTTTGVPFNAVEGQPFTGTVATFVTNPPQPCGDFTATIDWGDGSVGSAGTITQTSLGHCAISGTHTYLDVSPPAGFTVTVTLNGNFMGSPATILSTAFVHDAPLSASFNQSLVLTTGDNQNVILGTFTDGNTVDNDLDDVPSSYAVTINWGDGTGVDTTSGYLVPQGNGVYEVLGSHDFMGATTCKVSFTVTDLDSNTSEPGTQSASADRNFCNTTTPPPGPCTGLIHVTADQGVPAAENSTFNGKVGSFTDDCTNVPPSAYSATVTITKVCPNSQTFVETVANGGLVPNGSGGYDIVIVQGYDIPFVAEQCETFTTHIVVTDGTRTASADGTLQIIEDEAGAAAAVSAIVTKSFSGTVATFQVEKGSTASGYSATINWGDGSAASTGTITSDGHGGYLVRGSHTYANPGSTPFTVNIKSSSDSDAYNGTAQVAGMTHPYTAKGTLNYPFAGHWTPGKVNMTLNYTDSQHIGGSFTFDETAKVGTGIKAKTTTIELSNMSFNSVVQTGNTAYILGTATRAGNSGYTYLLTLVKSGVTGKVGLQVWAPGAVPVSDMTFSPTSVIGSISLPSS
jgi:hypothetical protein